MGSSASKTTRKLPKCVEPPKWAGKRTPGSSTGTTGEQVDETLANEHRSNEHRSKVIERDAQDPHLLANLRQLGPVNVDHHMKSLRHEPAASNTARLFQARSDHANDLEAIRQNRGQTTSNTQFSTLQLTSALNARKEAADVGMVKSATQTLGIDFGKVESLARFVNTPSVSTGNVKRRVDESGHEQVIAKAVWIDAPYAHLNITANQRIASTGSLGGDKGS